MKLSKSNVARQKIIGPEDNYGAHDPIHNQPLFHYEISFPDFSPSEAVKSDIEHYLLKLERIYSRITSCHIIVRAPVKRRRSHVYHIHIHLTIPGEDLIVSHEPEKDQAHADIHVAIRDAFEALHRQLKERIRLRNKKTIIPPINHHIGTITRFDPYQGYGFIEDRFGREVFFHQNSLLYGSKTMLRPGLRVRFHEENGEKGNHVTSMTIISPKKMR